MKKFPPVEEKLILGKFRNLPSRDYKEISQLNLDDYSEIYFIADNCLSHKENCDLINKIPPAKIILVSTIWVYSIHFKRQWNNFPNDMFDLEKIVLQSGGRVVRVGDFDEGISPSFNSYFALTKIKDFINYINRVDKSDIENIYTLEQGKYSGSKLSTKLINSFQFLSKKLPGYFFFQRPLEFFLILLGVKNYGFYLHTNLLFNETTQLGYGVLGKAFSSSFSENKNIFVSPFEDVMLDENGFRGTRIGKKDTGLSKFWHGVRCSREGGAIFKKVPLFVKRHKLPISANFGEAVSLNYQNNSFRILLHSKIFKLELLTSRLILACGAIQNTKLLLNLTSQKKAKLDDHEIGFIGTIDSNEAVRKKYIQIFGPFVIGRKLFYPKESFEAIYDFRPNSLNASSTGENLYNNKAKNILKKILSRMSISQLNEAFFNKFGIGFKTKKLAVFIQFLLEDCIEVSNSSLKRIRSNKEKHDFLLKKINQEFDSFIPNKSLYFFDGIHIQGASDILDDHNIKKLIQSKKLVILGAPSYLKLSALHNTWELIDYIKEKHTDSYKKV